MKLRLGLSGKFWTLALMALVLCAGLGYLSWRQQVGSVDGMAYMSTEAIRHAGVQTEQRRALSSAQVVSDAIVNSLYYLDLPAIGEVVRATLRQSDVAYVLVYDVEGRILHDGSRDIPRFGQRMDDPLAASTMRARRSVVQVGGGVVDAAVPVFMGRDRIGGVRVGISLSGPSEIEVGAIASVQERAREVKARVLGAATLLLLLLLVLGLVTAWLVSHHLVRPIKRLARVAQQIERGNYEVGWPLLPRRDEIGDLEEAMARMGESVGRHDRDIRRLAYGDSLTGLPNRMAFREMLRNRIQTAERGHWTLALMFVDLDDFKRINDTLGHDAGDEVLMQFAVRLRSVVASVGMGQAEIARFGGDEFVLLLTGDDARLRATRVAQAFLAALRQPVVLGHTCLVLAASIGITLYPADADSATMMLKNADIAMYRAKLDGKNCYRFYTRDMDLVVERQVQLEQELRQALERGELSVCYQPILSLEENRIVGAEALVRWIHPERGSIPPSLFVTVAEQTGQIDAIGRLVLGTACRDAASWPEASDAFISVNISGRQFQGDHDVVRLVEEELNKAGLPARRVRLELTETALFANESRVVAAATRLRRMGVKIWLDDFGTGFSGLKHLRRMPADGVKIDRSFVSGMPDDAEDVAMTSAIVMMAHAMGMTVTAEGVENQAQVDALHACRCDHVQGYWVGKPMSSEELAARLETAVFLAHGGQ